MTGDRRDAQWVVSGGSAARELVRQGYEAVHAMQCGDVRWVLMQKESEPVTVDTMTGSHFQAA